jgi:MSHA biogenesis protein MshQ
MTAATPVRFGVLAVGSAYGSDLLTLRLPVTAMYWNGTGWANNTADTCTGPLLSNASIALGNEVQKPGTTGSFSTSVASSPTLPSTWSQGTGWITLTPPSTAGTAQVALNLGSSSPDASCTGWSVASTGSHLTWLRGKWCGSNYSVDPSSLASFGTAATPFVYFRENH